MTPIRITETFYITSQVSAADIPKIAAAGFAVIVNNRPDGEAPDQPGQADICQIAAQEGLDYLYLPTTGATLNAEAAKAFRAALEAAPGPVLAHCRSGARSFALWAISEVLAGQIKPEALAALAAERGCDPSVALSWLSANGHMAANALPEKGDNSCPPNPR
ncbi:TIGR01244 family sulfur transferase [Acidocella sp.]|uniref:TIGR01244 family sulfur transferase n=1 Tax=Acidocella sp. TaxID=50710 RepID=UPI003D03E843